MKKIGKLLTISFLFLGLSTPIAHAEETAGGFTIEGVLNSHQIDPDAGYFYLNEGVGAEDSVKVKLINSSNEPKTLKVKVTDANTNVNGLIDYTGSLKNHASLKTPLTSIAKVTQKEVVVPEKSSIDTEIKIKMPSQKFSGVILGGINVSEKQEEEASKKQLALKNQYSYTLGLVLTNENKVEINKHVSVELEQVAPVLFDGKKIVEASILNSNPYIFSGAKVKGEVFDQRTKQLVKKAEKDSVNIAPYSVYPFQIDWEKEELKPGKYIFKGLVEAGGKKWKFEKGFEITSQKAKRINKESVYKVFIPNWLTYSIYGLLFISISGTLYLIVRRKS